MHTHEGTKRNPHRHTLRRAGDTDDIKGIYGAAWPRWRPTHLRHFLGKNRHTSLETQWYLQTRSHTGMNNQADTTHIGGDRMHLNFEKLIIVQGVQIKTHWLSLPDTVVLFPLGGTLFVLTYFLCNFLCYQAPLQWNHLPVLIRRQTHFLILRIGLKLSEGWPIWPLVMLL